MISVDTIYQRVLAAANKEQRGYVTPQEFNLFANQAQMDIFDQYFYDVDKFSRVHGYETEAGDMLDLLNEKIDIFEEKGVAVVNGTILPQPPAVTHEMYILGNIIYTNTSTGISYEAERVSEKEYMQMINSPLTQPRVERPIYVRDGNSGPPFNSNTVRVYIHNPASGITFQTNGGVTCNYTRKPVQVNWNYVVVQGYAQYDNTTSVNFELHLSEENNLVHKILELAGIVMKDANLYQIASQEEIKDIQQEKS